MDMYSSFHIVAFVVTNLFSYSIGQNCQSVRLVGESYVSQQTQLDCVLGSKADILEAIEAD